jgi:uncharacterized membrane protein
MAGWSGPLPPPSALAAFDDIVENGAERVFQQFEAEAEHRRRLEREAADTDKSLGLVSRLLAGGFALAALGTAGFALHVDAHVAAAIIGGGTIAAVVTAFLAERSSPRG